MKQADMRRADTVVVLDFETTGMSPDRGDRTIEVGAVRLEAGQVTGRFQSLMNPGIRINACQNVNPRLLTLFTSKKVFQSVLGHAIAFPLQFEISAVLKPVGLPLTRNILIVEGCIVIT